MSGFTRFKAFARVAVGGTTYRLWAPLQWDIGKKGSGWRLTVPEDRLFDLSVPRGLHWLLSPHNRAWLPAAAVHDELLRLGFDRAFAAAEFRRAVAARAPNDWRGWPAFVAVLNWTMLREPKAER